jgi:hypothetical protein
MSIATLSDSEKLKRWQKKDVEWHQWYRGWRKHNPCSDEDMIDEYAYMDLAIGRMFADLQTPGSLARVRLWTQKRDALLRGSKKSKLLYSKQVDDLLKQMNNALSLEQRIYDCDFHFTENTGPSDKLLGEYDYMDKTLNTIYQSLEHLLAVA